MQTIEALKRKIKSTNDLLGVVKTMKALAAVSIRQYQRAVEALDDYQNTVEMGLQAVLKNKHLPAAPARGKAPVTLGAIVFGSDQGLCGQLNAGIAAFTLDELHKTGVPPEHWRIISVGERVCDLLEDSHVPVSENLGTPGSTAGITPAVQELILLVEDWHFRERIEHIHLFYNDYISGATYRPTSLHLLPIDENWLRNIQARRWESRSLPLYTMDFSTIFPALIREYLFVALFKALAESLASENASRLAAMQNAEKNIEERLEEIHRQFHRQRQMSITEELLDIVAGYEVLKSG